MADTKVRLTDGRDLSIAQIAAEFAGREFRVFTVYVDPSFPCVQLAGNMTYGIIGSGLARRARVVARGVLMADVLLSTGEHVVCSRGKTWMLLDGSWRAANKLVRGDRLRVLATDILPGTNPDIMPLLPIPTGHRLVTTVVLPEILVESVTMVGPEDAYDLSVENVGASFALSAGVIVSATG